MGTFISASAFSTLAGLISLLAGFAGSIVVARLFGPQGAGDVAFALFLVTSLAMVVDLGTPNVLLRYMQAHDRPGNPGGGLVRLLLPEFLVPSVIGTVALAAYGLWLHLTGRPTDHAPSIWVMAGVFLLVYTAAAVSDAASRGLNRFAETTRLIFIGCLLQVPLIVIGGYFYGAAGALAGYLARHLPQALDLRRYVSGGIDPDTAVTAKMKATGRNNWLSAIIGMIIWTRVEFFFLGFHFDASEIGHYAAGLTLAALVVQLPTQMLSGLTPHFGRHHDNGDLARMRLTYQRITRWLALLILPVCLGGAAIMGELLPLLFGAEFEEAVPMARVLVAFAFLSSFAKAPNFVIIACERSDFLLRASVLAAVLSLSAFAIAVPAGAGLGAAWARTLVHGIWMVWLVAFCWRRLSLPFDVRGLLLIALAALFCAMAAYGVLQEVRGWGGLVLAVAAGGVVYAVALRLFRVIPREDVEVLTANLPSRMPRILTQAAYRMVLLTAAPGGRGG